MGGFSGTTEVSIGAIPRALVIGDFNNDGTQDFATTANSAVSIRSGICLVTPTPTPSPLPTQTPMLTPVMPPLSAVISVFRPSVRRWHLLGFASGFSAAQLGLSSDRIVAADYDGDGQADIAVFRDGA